MYFIESCCTVTLVGLNATKAALTLRSTPPKLIFLSSSSAKCLSSPVSLPSELLANVVSFVDEQALKNLRTVCRLFSRLATDRLFEHVSLSPDADSYGAFEAILERESLARVVKKVYIKTKEWDDVSTDTYTWRHS